MYQAVVRIGEQAEESSRTLEEYLRALIRLVQPEQNASHLATDFFLQVMAEALTQTPLPFDEIWASEYPEPQDPAESFDDWFRTAIQQVVDLREMAASGTFANRLRYFGVRSPRGSYWFNFDIGTYLECAMAGTYGGWQEGDSHRKRVSEPAAELEADASLSSADPIINVPSVDWEHFTRFIECGQFYE
jgi:hypothetical protein